MRRCLALVLLWAWASPGVGAVPIPPLFAVTPPPVEVKTWLLLDFHSDWVLAERDALARIEPASLTKLMTAYAVFRELKQGRLRLSDEVSVSEKAWRMPGSRMFLRAGSRAAVEDLLSGMIVQSGNDATVALAEHVAGNEPAFVARMNQYAAELGMVGTHFANSTGLPDPGHYSTARDLGRLASRLLREFPEHYQRFASKEYTFNQITQHNRNALLWSDASVDGIKTGHTRSAGYCLVASAKREGMRLIAIVVGARNEQQQAAEARKLLDFGFRAYETRLLYQGATPAVSVPVWLGEAGSLPLGIGRDLYVTIPRGAHARLQADLTVPEQPVAPITAGQRLGSLKLSFNGEAFAEYPLVALREIAPGSWWQQAVDMVRMRFL